MNDERIRQEAREAEAKLRPPSEEQTVPAASGLNIRAAGSGASSAEVEQLKAELQRQRVEAGRLKKANEDLAAAQTELAETRRKLSEANAKGATDRALDFIAPERRAIVDEDVMKGSADIASGMVRETEARLNAEIAELRAQQEQFNQAAGAVRSGAFDTQIEQAFPGFIAKTNAGGEFHAAWAQFLGTEDPATGLPYERSIQDAHGRQRIAGVSRIINTFLEESGVGRRASLVDAVVPSGSASEISGQPRGRDTNVYTTGEMEKALQDARSAYERGSIDLKVRNAITQKFQMAISEGRVVRGEQRRG
jgi:hypothetical protein